MYTRAYNQIRLVQTHKPGTAKVQITRKLNTENSSHFEHLIIVIYIIHVYIHVANIYKQMLATNEFTESFWIHQLTNYT